MNPDYSTSREAGAALYLALVIGIVLMGMSTVMVSVSTTTTQENETARKHMVRLHLAESGVPRALLDLGQGGDGDLGTMANPVAFGRGGYWVDTTDNGDGTYTVISRGRYSRGERVVAAVVQEIGGVFHHAVFAGNVSGDVAYDLDFGGTTVQADVVNGDIYSGNDILVTGDAILNGEVRATGSITGASGETGVTQPIPDMAAMGYETNHDVNVAQQFTQSQYWSYDSAGGYAWQLPSSKEGHIFRKNPTDRYSEYSSTSKDDFFLEDPFETVRVDSNQNGSDPYQITLTGGDDPGPEGNEKVYFIDGNLWIHNRRTYSLKLKYTGEGGTRLTFVVKGNVYISDNLFIDGGLLSGVAIIAIQDAAVPDSGNVYFGDPAFGTLQQMNAFLYGENSFYDNNLDASGSAAVDVNGMMSAGDHVEINRTWSNGQHSRLTVNFDSRIKDGSLDLPGLPTAGGGSSAFAVLAWREVAQQ